MLVQKFNKFFYWDQLILYWNADVCHGVTYSVLLKSELIWLLFLFIVLYQPDSGYILQDILHTDGNPVASSNIVFPFPSAYLNNENFIHWNKTLTNSCIQI